MNPPSVTAELSPYRDREQRSVANHLGLWTFLATEILFFGGLFTCYAVYRMSYPEAFAEGSGHLEFWIGTTNTAVLLTSSLCMALGDDALRSGGGRSLRWWLLATGGLGAVFLALKGYEYFDVIQQHLVPGAGFDAAAIGVHAPQVQLFLFLYFAMTGLHAAHMLAGLVAIAWLLALERRGRLSAERSGAVAMVALYWHFVDCVWVFLYPLLYLIPHS
jgi:cytochrome c oxidase subunit 3